MSIDEAMNLEMGNREMRKKIGENNTRIRQIYERVEKDDRDRKTG